ncbi:diacylglycerol/lipid kinase family protein [Paenibacillus gallinarum]|uniref:YegS/Rv2252/BmrU family lipid kinase n=1 Tax=Paenibacillus gallinarum TaxID=2762232 RepID=A0ABR8SZZ4_9BACL|nr:YegS/Rv2252/BmrU family lipid kinase [Paenibacillus gallinarum]MBD7969084.1 YegS/Rv2252/BmrU family lipid kinase [Paenibacillus gallinarum]
MKITKALLIHNDAAGSAAGSLVSSAVAVLAPAIKELDIIQTSGPGDGEKICLERGGEVDVVFILGGDGTVHECINGLTQLDHPPVVGVLPGGTCNDFVRSLGMPVDVTQSARMMLEGRIIDIDLGFANGRVFTNFFGVGLITDTSVNIDSNLKNSLGKLSYFISTLQTIRSAVPFAFEMEADGKLIQDEAVMIYIANGRSLGSSALPFAQDALMDGQFDVLIIRQTGLPLLKELLARKPEGEWQPKNDSILYYKARNIKLRTDEEKQADTDGEVYLSTPVQISVLDHKLTFLVGGPDAI